MKTPVIRKIAMAMMLISLTFVMTGEPAAYAAVAPDASAGSMNDKLTQLEMRFFEHPYGEESGTDRLNRLENFVFGQTRTGTDQQRIDSLVLVMPPAKPALQKAQPQQDMTAYGGNKPSANQAPNRPYTASPAPPYTSRTAPPYTASQAPNPPYGGNQASDAGYGPGGLEPTVTALENHVLGTTHKGQGIASRLNTLEESVFSADADHNGSFAERISRLKMAVGEDSSTAQAPIQPPPNYQQGYTATSHTQALPPVAKTNNGHPVLKKAAEAAIIVGAVAGVAALTIMAAKGMGGGGKRGMFKHLDLD